LIEDFPAGNPLVAFSGSKEFRATVVEGAGLDDASRA
jgi:hypothetical protein